MQQARIVVFAKAPLAGSVKTRLIPALGAQGACTLARQMLHHTLQQARTAHIGPVELCMSPAPDHPAWRGVDVPADVTRSAQGAGDLGERMARAVLRVTTQPGQSVLLVGTDCPGLTAAQMRAAAGALASHDAVLIPATDGGYVLLGLKAPCPELFSHMPWSTCDVTRETLRRMVALDLRAWQAPPLHDIDEPADLVHLPAPWHVTRTCKTNQAPALVDTA